MTSAAALAQDQAALEQLQLSFAAAVLDLAPDFAEQVCGGAGLPAEDRLDIYRHAYRERLIETLQDSYAHTAAYLGEAAFRGLALAYIDEHASQHSSLRQYGEQLAPWVARRHPRDPEVAELAALDWAMRQAFDCRDAQPIDLARLGAFSPQDWEQLGFELHPAFAVLHQQHNTVSIWQAVDQDQPAPAVTRLPDAVAVLIWRREWQPHFRTVAAAEAAALLALHAGASFAELCAACAGPSATGVAADSDAGQAAAMRAGAWLQRWVQDGLICGFTTSGQLTAA